MPPFNIFNIFNFFISPAYAATPTAGQAGSGSSFIIMTVALLAMMYFMVLRPQNRRARELRILAASVKKGDEIVTASGLLGTLTHVMDNHVRLMLSDGVEVVMQKSAIASLLPKGTLKTL